MKKEELGLFDDVLVIINRVDAGTAAVELFGLVWGLDDWVIYDFLFRKGVLMKRKRGWELELEVLFIVCTPIRYYYFFIIHVHGHLFDLLSFLLLFLFLLDWRIYDLNLLFWLIKTGIFRERVISNWFWCLMVVVVVGIEVVGVKNIQVNLIIFQIDSNTWIILNS